MKTFTKHLATRLRRRKDYSKQNSNRYQYSALDEENQEIRILTLFPGSPSSDIRISLETAVLTKDIVPQYEALSYAWGSQEYPANIYVADGNGGQLAITQNLHEALPYLRHEEQPRRLWIDAICMNQQNWEERSSQVQRMGDIYKLAERVVIWLGPENDTSTLAFDTIRDLGSKVEIDWDTLEMRPVCQDDTEWADYNLVLPYDQHTLYAVCRIFNRQLFGRLWVLQENRLSNSKAVVSCGPDTILLSQLRVAIYVFTAVY